MLTLATTESPSSLSTPTGSKGDEEDGDPPINQTESFNDLMNFMALYANFSQENRISMGHDVAGFIRACTFSGKSCSNVTLYVQYVYVYVLANDIQSYIYPRYRNTFDPMQVFQNRSNCQLWKLFHVQHS